MDKRDFESLKVFDGDKFAVWKYHMELCFDEKDIMPIVNGTILKQQTMHQKRKKTTSWRKCNTLARRMIGSCGSLPVLENLVNCATALCMWTTLCAFYQQNSKENIYMVQNSCQPKTHTLECVLVQVWFRA